jgi:hypothetical protein
MAIKVARAAVGLAAAAPRPVPAELPAVPAHVMLVNPTWLSDPTPGPRGTLVHWTRLTLDLINNNYAQGPSVLVKASDGVNYLDMNQAGELGGLYQVVGATPGASYTLRLDTCAWAQNSIPRTIGYELYDPASSAVLDSGSFTDSVGGTWVTRTLTAVAISSSIGVRIQGLAALSTMSCGSSILVPRTSCDWRSIRKEARHSPER